MAQQPNRAEIVDPRAETPRLSGGFRAAIDKARAKRLADVPRIYKNLYKQAYGGGSRKAAIRATCLECVGWQWKEVQLCTGYACPLYAYRPKMRTQK